MPRRSLGPIFDHTGKAFRAASTADVQSAVVAAAARLTTSPVIGFARSNVLPSEALQEALFITRFVVTTSSDKLFGIIFGIPQVYRLKRCPGLAELAQNLDPLDFNEADQSAIAARRIDAVDVEADTLIVRELRVILADAANFCIEISKHVRERPDRFFAIPADAGRVHAGK
jgi:hypothetical protein